MLVKIRRRYVWYLGNTQGDELFSCIDAIIADLFRTITIVLLHIGVMIENMIFGPGLKTLTWRMI